MTFINMALSEDADCVRNWATHTAYIMLKSVRSSPGQHVLLEAAVAEKEPTQGLMDSPGSGGWK